MEAEQTLLKEENIEGIFIVRYSETYINQFTLSVKAHNAKESRFYIKHFAILRIENDQYCFNRQTTKFKSLNDLIQENRNGTYSNVH